MPFQLVVLSRFRSSIEYASGSDFISQWFIMRRNCCSKWHDNGDVRKGASRSAAVASGADPRARAAARDDFAFVPFSRDYVRHIAGWYAQKHPDEDFAETFAVWLDPASRWRTRYVGWSAMRKLEYVDDITRQVGSLPPIRPAGETDVTVEEMEQTVEDFYKKMQP